MAMLVHQRVPHFQIQGRSCSIFSPGEVEPDPLRVGPDGGGEAEDPQQPLQGQEGRAVTVAAKPWGHLLDAWMPPWHH